MNDAAPASSSPIAALQARLERLARDPRARLIPELPTVLIELRAVLASIDDGARRLAALEQLAARAFPPPQQEFQNTP